MTEALQRDGFRFIEVLAPCSTIYARRNKLGTGLDLMRYYYENAVIDHDASGKDLDIGFQSKIIVGKFVDENRPSYGSAMDTHLRKVLGKRYVPPITGRDEVNRTWVAPGREKSDGEEVKA
jgi:2-oxoglutarate ferredoxin oxidoreductase subunit beta